MVVWTRAVVRTWRCRPTNFSRAFSEKLPTSEPKGRNIQWVFLGCPGVGKGTYAARLSKLLGVPHIATGDLVRQQLSSHGPLASKLVDIVSQGQLISDEIVIDLLSKRLEAGEAKGETGFILDGFPRTIRQASGIWHAGACYGYNLAR